MAIKLWRDVYGKIIRYNDKLDREGITGSAREVLLRTYVQDLTDKINVDVLKIVV